MIENWKIYNSLYFSNKLFDINTEEILKTYNIKFSPKLDSKDIDVKIPLTSEEYKKLFDTKDYSMYYDLQGSKGNYIIYHSYLDMKRR